MEYRKFIGDRIFDGYRFIDDHVLITTADGRIEDIVAANDAGDGVQVVTGFLLPGLINCHCHLELSHMKGLIPERTGLVDFVLKIVTERHHSETEVLSAIEEAEEEMLLNGIVAVGDICNNALTIPQKKRHWLRYYNFIEVSGWLPLAAQDRFAKAVLLSGEFSSVNDSFSIVPHAPYSVSDNLWQEITPGFQGKIVSIHNQETPFEDEFFRNGTGDFLRMYQLMNIRNTHHQPTARSSLQSYFARLTKATRIILVHNTYINQEDIDYIRELESGSDARTFFCLCVNANQYIENTMPPIGLLRKNNCPTVLGTDSLASNRSLNILDEIKTIRKHFPNIPLEEMFQWATINGARALQMDNELGSFDKGKKPGILLMDERDLSVKRLL